MFKLLNLVNSNPINSQKWKAVQFCKVCCAGNATAASATQHCEVSAYITAYSSYCSHHHLLITYTGLTKSVLAELSPIFGTNNALH